MTITELKYIVAVATTMHFARAAEKCFVSQPTLSIAIKKLEDSLGINIFERSNTKITITPPGQTIIAKARQILAQVAEIESFVAANKDPFLQPLKVGAIHTIGPYLFPLLIKEINHAIPQLKLIITEDFTHNLEQKLSAGELDAIIIATAVNNQSISVIPLYAENLVVILPSSHKLAAKSSINSNLLGQEETILILGQGHCFRDQVLDVCPNCQNISAQNLAITTSSIETIKHMVSLKMGLSVVPQSAITNNVLHSEITVRPFSKKSPTRQVVLAYRTSFVRHDVLTKLAKLISMISSEFVDIVSK